jgi:predicted nucleic acid-binding protein
VILVDSSVWIDHFRGSDPAFMTRLEAGEILMHPFVLGELMLGSVRDRPAVFAELAMLPRAAVATPAEVLTLIERQSLHGRGIGYVDAALLAAVLLDPEARLWTRDRRLAAIAEELSLSAPEAA